jgi:hypothetical protein
MLKSCFNIFFLVKSKIWPFFADYENEVYYNFVFLWNHLLDKLCQASLRLFSDVPFHVIPDNLGLYPICLPLLNKASLSEISIFRNSRHLGWRTALYDTILKREHPSSIPGKVGFIADYCLLNSVWSFIMVVI